MYGRVGIDWSRMAWPGTAGLLGLCHPLAGWLGFTHMVVTCSLHSLDSALDSSYREVVDAIVYHPNLSGPKLPSSGAVSLDC